MKPYDALPDFNCNDPAPLPIPRPRSRLRSFLVALGASLLIVALAACIFPMAGLAILMWLS